jgi:hypothetical protein
VLSSRSVALSVHLVSLRCSRSISDDGGFGAINLNLHSICVGLYDGT